MGLTSSVGKSVQNELMTSREWQHALYFRDRWTPTAKLTLDLGLRWEYYPLMSRAEGRGLERLDLNTLEVILGGRGGNPKNVGLEAGLDNFAPRLGAIYRLNPETVLRTGYGVTFNNMGWGRPVRGDLQYPITLATTFTQPLTFMWYSRLAEGIPQVVGPDQSTGRVRTSELGRYDDAGARPRSIAARSTPGTSRSSAGSRGICPWTWHTSAPRESTGTRGSTSTCRRPSEAVRTAGRISSATVVRSRSIPGARGSTPTTTRCRSPSTGRSRTASC